MRAALGLLSLEEGLTALTAGTAAAAAAALYCGIGGSDVFLILVGLFALGVAGFCASARWTGQRKLLRFAQWLQWANLALFFLVGVLLCSALGGNFHWAYAHPAAQPAHLLTGLLDLVSGEDAWPSLLEEPEEAEKPPVEVWALGGALDPGQQMKCQFPFTFKGKKYEECAAGVSPPPHGGAWSVERDMQHPWCMTDQAWDRWGYCLSTGGWRTSPVAPRERETVVHARVTVPHQAVVLLFVVLCQLVLSSFSICILEALCNEDQGRMAKDGWRGYGALDAHGPPAYAPGYATAYAPRSQPPPDPTAGWRFVEQPRSQQPPDAVFHPAMPPR